jgi:hypothetical protein
MDSELMQLQKRVAALEAALAARSATRRNRVLFSSAGAAVLGFGIAVLMTQRLEAQGQHSEQVHDVLQEGRGQPMSPLNVVAPFVVFDNKGRRLFAVSANVTGGGGEALLFNAAGQPRIQLDVSSLDDGRVSVTSGDKSETIIHGGTGFQVRNSKGNMVARLGVTGDAGGGGTAEVLNGAGHTAARFFATASGDGALDINHGAKPMVELGTAQAGDGGIITLHSNTTQARTVLLGDYGIRQVNAQGNPAFQAGPDDNGNGYAMVANRGGVFMSKMTTATNGSSGRVEVSAGGEIKVLVGVLTNNKGEVCATGDGEKQVCMSGLAIKTLTPY